MPKLVDWFFLRRASSMLDVMNACTSVLTDSVSSDRRTRLSRRCQKKTRRTNHGDMLI